MLYTWCGRGPGNINGLFSVKVVIFREKGEVFLH